jgi:hypothetical protein
MSDVHQQVAAAVRDAREQARAILVELEKTGSPETAHSNALYLALVGIQKRLSVVDPPPVSIAQFMFELDQLARQCEGKLASIKPLIEKALSLARQG